VSPSVTVGPRVEFDLDHYPRIRVWDPRAGKERYVYLHRLALFAQGEVDDLWGSWQGHHEDGDRWNNDPENLAALDPGEHDAAHRHRVARRPQS